jgi:hyperosmotically inducible periplasmic protein
MDTVTAHKHLAATGRFLSVTRGSLGSITDNVKTRAGEPTESAWGRVSPSPQSSVERAFFEAPDEGPSPLEVTKGEYPIAARTTLIYCKPMRKVLALIACLGAWLFLGGLSGCASHRHTRIRDQRPADTPARVTEQTLDDNHNTNTAQRVNDNPNRSPQPGVGDTRDPSTDQRIEDNRTAERVRETLAASLKYRYDGVQVAVSNGVVQLSGFVNTKAQKTNATEIITKLPGVKSVENNLTVKD